MTLTITPAIAFVFALVFARLGSMLMVLPAIGDINVPARVRLALALMLTLVLLPLVRARYGGLPEGLWVMAAMLSGEILVGLFVGLSARLIMSAAHVAGTVLAFQTSLGFAQNVDPAQGTQGALLASFMTLLAATLVFAFDLHHLLIAALYDSYEFFRPGELLPFGDLAEMALTIAAGAFKVGIQLAAPFLVFGLIFYMGIGILSRLMPQVQIFFIAIPANILLGFLLLMLLLGTMMMWFTDHFAANMAQFTR